MSTNRDHILFRPNNIAFSLVCTIGLSAYIASRADGAELASQLREPVAMVLADEGRLLLVANRRSGTISSIDTRSRRVLAETSIGRELADLAMLPGGNRLLAVDYAAGQLVVLGRKGSTVQALGRLDVSPYPVSVAISPDGHACYVASLWSRRVTIVDLHSATKPAVTKVIDLPFAPRRQQVLPGGKLLVVADAFGGRLALIDVAAATLRSVRRIDGHNLADLALTADGNALLVSHQILNSYKSTTRPSVHWGGVMLNVVRSLPVEKLRQKSRQEHLFGTVAYLGIPDAAAGDPGALAVAPGGRRVVTFAGVSEVAVSDDGVGYTQRVSVGRRPTAITLDPACELAYVACTLDDSVAIVNLESTTLQASVPLGPRPELSLADRGQMLFYDARLARDGWYSCHSCHTDGHTNGLLNDNFGDETYGAPKRVLSLLGTVDTEPWAWNGSAKKLETQIHKSIEVTMQGPAADDDQVAAIAAYLRTLRPAPALAKARGELNAPAIARGRAVFAERGCADCHRHAAYTTPEVYDVGLADEQGGRRFNPPSLRGVSQRGRLFHDGRAASLRAVLERYEHGLEEALAPGELEDLLSFLQSL